MRKKLLGTVFAAALLLGSAVPLVGVGDVHADRGGCPNVAAANGAAHANDNSAHGTDKQDDRDC